MTRKDSEKDSDRPHYYSQFWLDIAAGRKVIGASKTNEEAETAESEPMEPATARKSGRTSVQPVADGRRDMYSPDVLEPEDVAEEEEEIIEPEVEEEDLGQEEELNDQDLPNIVVDEEIPDMAIDQEPEPEPEPEPDLSLEEIDEDIFDEEEEEDEEEPWAAGRGRKKPKPGRQTKQPKRPIKRERRPGF